MLFNSLDFAVFIPIFFMIYWIISENVRLRNIFLLFASYIFYGWWDWRFLLLIVFSSSVDFIVGNQISKSENFKKRRGLLFISLFVNLGMLIYFKYTNFFIESFINSFRLFGKEIESLTLNIILPVGISFYTFQTLSYTIDIYRNKISPARDWISFFAFVAFFPQLVAGPIERASHLLPQFYKVYSFNYNRVKSGILLVLFGFFKKMVIADRLAVLVNHVYNNSSEHYGLDFIIATIFFAIQIYCDFSGYSDIAIGLSRVMGFDLMKNFDSPYFSKSITEFWRRWHISLSTWFRDYVYIPLGGSRKLKYRVYFNLFIVFFISGIWHGAAINFVIWGAIHGLIIVVEKAFKPILYQQASNFSINLSSLGSKLFFTTLTFFTVCVAWVFFRANSFGDVVNIFSNLFYNSKSHSVFELGLSPHEFYASVIFILLLFIIDFMHSRINIMELLDRESKMFRYTIYTTLIFIIFIFGIYGDDSVSEFIYFQF